VTMSKVSGGSLLDRIGFWSSALCALHCTAMPIVLAMQPLFLWFRVSRVVDNTLLGIAATVGLGGCLWSFRRHHDMFPLMLVVAGLTTIGFGRGLGMRTLVIAGPLLMAYGLWLNRRLCKCSTCLH